MKNRKKTAAGLILAAVLLISFCAFLTVPLLYAVILEPCAKDASPIQSSTDDVIFYTGTPGKYAEGFVISYTHSVNKGRVKDYYRIVKDGTGYVLELHKTQFLSYGAGIPEPEYDESFTITDDYIEISGMERKMDSLVMAVGVIAEHSIEFKSTVYNLKTYFDPQERIRISYKKISLAKYIFCFFRQRVITI
ncbi:MAG TPA: DUF1850 domain-containing protein [Treponemataceae bacterium]|nr:DUF1850 domain-containing protein [Treponemataceae bacterium]